MKRTLKHTRARNPAVTLPGIVTEQDREIVRRRATGETRKVICDALGVTVAMVQRAESRCRDDARGRGLLVDCHDSIEGLCLIEELSGDAGHALRYHHSRYGGPEITKLSEAAALGRAYVSRMKGIGAKSLASLDRALDLFGIAWSPIDRTPKPKPKPTQREREGEHQQIHQSAWSDIVRRTADMERALGTGVLRDAEGRDSMQGVSFRLAFLSGYMESRFKRARDTIDITPEQDDGAYETAGNLICLPGVKLVDVQPSGGGAS